MVKRCRAGALALLVSLCHAPQAPGASIVAVTEDYLVDTSEVIVHGTVLSAETAFIQGAVVTESSLEVHEILKGELPGPLVHIITAGGEFNGARYSIPGTPGFRVGERVCAFLHRGAMGWYLTGVSQGKYRLEQDPSTGLVLARRSTAGFRVPAPTTGQTRRQALQGAAPAEETWDAFRRRILARVESGP